VSCESERWGFPHAKCSSSRIPVTELAVRPSASSPLQPSLSLLRPLNNPPSMHSLLSGTKWSTIISHRWRYPSAHINELEAHAFLLSLRWLLSSPSSFGSRIFSLIDSSAVYYGVLKGRSSSSLYGLIRRISALLLCSCCQVLPIWVPSSWNPADRPSRAPTWTKLRSVLPHLSHAAEVE
jgi:hypothetical protein